MAGDQPDEDPIARIRSICLALPEAVEQPFGGHTAPSFRVRDKLFVMISEDRTRMTCKAPPGEQQALVGSDAVRFFVPAYVGHKGWVGVRLDESALPPEPAGPKHHFEQNTLKVFRPITDPDTHEKLGTLYVQANLEQMYARLRQNVGIVAIVLVVASVIALIISARLQRVIPAVRAPVKLAGGRRPCEFAE